MNKFLIIIVMLFCVFTFSCSKEDKEKKEQGNKETNYSDSHSGDSQYGDIGTEVNVVQRKQLNEYGVDFNGVTISIVSRETYRINPFSDEYTFSDKLQRQKEIRMIENAYNCQLQFVQSYYSNKRDLENARFWFTLMMVNYVYVTEGLEAAQEEFVELLETTGYGVDYHSSTKEDESKLFDELVFSNPTFYYSPMFEDTYIYNPERVSAFEHLDVFNHYPELRDIAYKHLYKLQYFLDSDKMLFADPSHPYYYGLSEPFQIPADEVPLINLATTTFVKSDVEHYTELQNELIGTFTNKENVDLVKSFNQTTIRALLTINKKLAESDKSLIDSSYVKVLDSTMAYANYCGMIANSVDEISDEYIEMIVDNILNYESLSSFFYLYPWENNYSLSGKHLVEETDETITVTSPYIFGRKEESVIPSTYYTYKMFAPLKRIIMYNVSDLMDLMVDLSVAFEHNPKVEYEKLAYANRNNEKTLEYIEMIKDMDFSFDYAQLLNIPLMYLFDAYKLYRTGEFDIKTTTFVPGESIRSLIHFVVLGKKEGFNDLSGYYPTEEANNKFFSLSKRDKLMYVMKEYVNDLKDNINNYNETINNQKSRFLK